MLGWAACIEADSNEHVILYVVMRGAVLHYDTLHDAKIRYTVLRVVHRICAAARGVRLCYTTLRCVKLVYGKLR